MTEAQPGQRYELAANKTTGVTSPTPSETSSCR